MYFGAERVNRSVPAAESAREAHSITNTLQKYILQLGKKNGESLSERAPWRESRGWGRESSFTGDPGRYVKKGSGYRHLSP
jgi:hypothetical protein